jgi:hypothetical protein
MKPLIAVLFIAFCAAAPIPPSGSCEVEGLVTETSAKSAHITLSITSVEAERCSSYTGRTISSVLAPGVFTQGQTVKGDLSYSSDGYSLEKARIIGNGFNGFIPAIIVILLSILVWFLYRRFRDSQRSV